jgi:DNA polymerase I-like protein with 3'-5' exonuclease and polymerase domains
VGGTALWATTEKEGIEDWRGSELSQTLVPDFDCPVIPTFHPSAILHAWGNRYLAIHDLKKANRIWQFGRTPAPAWNFILRPDFATVMATLYKIETFPEIAVDIETKFQRIACVGIAWSKLDAICIPLVRGTGAPYWSEEEECAIVLRLQHILQHHNCIGQNFHYDAQYFAREMLVIPSCSYDTMLAQHVLFPGTPKSLAHNSSLYCPSHVFWKDDGKEWDPRVHPEERLWSYNCVDCVKTFEVKEAQQALITKYELQPQLDFLTRLWPHVLLIMLRGVCVDAPAKAASIIELATAIAARQRWLDAVVGRPFNVKSAPQMKMFFHEEMGCKATKNRKTKKVSLDKKALHTIADKYPLLFPIVQVIEEIRSLSVFKSTFTEAPLDRDGRMRCSFNISGTETFRFSSSENAFGSGTNLQNIPSGNRSTTMVMPNMRKLFIPDPGMEIAEIDLAGADAQVVAWEANDEKLKAAFRARVKIHTVNSRDLFGDRAGADGKTEPWYTYAKQGVHLTNYLGQVSTLAATLNITKPEATAFQDKWFRLHPGIKGWHARVEASLAETRSVANRFGFRRVYFDRMADIMAEAVAWVPQSTVAIAVNHALIAIGEAKLPVDLLLQVHDSLVFQYPVAERERVLRTLAPLVLAPIPYADPLTIPFGLKTSTVSWGHIEERAWPASE